MHLGKKTKIIATIGPASSDEKTIKNLILAGVNIFRFNTKHNSNEWHVEHIKKVQSVARELTVTVGVLVDLQGPEIRIETDHNEDLALSEGERVLFAKSFEVAKEHPELASKVVKIAQHEVFGAISAGDSFSIDDGFIDFSVVSAHRDYFVAEAKENSILKTKKGLNLVGIDVDLPSLTAADKERIEILSHVDVDFVALSFVRSAKDVELLRREVIKTKLSANIISKIESQLGVDNIDEIIKVSDGIMVARGDLGIEVPIERMTHLQKQIIKKCREASKPVIVATQMLQSMVDSPRPTRAEAADIANAVYDEADCLMLSGETASGKFPVKSVETMRKIAHFNESHKQELMYKPQLVSQTHLIVSAAMSVINSSAEDKIDKVVVFTETGNTARIFSGFRPRVPVIAVSESDKTVRELSMSYGVVGIKLRLEESDLLYPEHVLKQLKFANLVEADEKILILHGHKYKQPGSTNALVIVNV